MDPELVQWIRQRNEKALAQSGSAMAQPSWIKEQWYHGHLDRATADTILAGRRPGLFLLRDSSTCLGDYVLSVSENNKVSHYIISRRGGLYLIGDQTFTDLPSVIEFYKKHFLDTTTLTECAPRPGSLHIGGAGPLGGQPPAPQPQPRPPTQEFVDASQPLPPPIPVTGKLVVQGKFDFKSDDPEDLSFKKGDRMTVLRKDEDEWWFARHGDGRTGSIPVPYVQIVEDQPQPFYARATMDRECPYDPTALSFKVEDQPQPFYARATMDRECPYDPTALSFKAGDTIKVTKQNENGMWEGELNGRKGHFPFKLVEVVDNTS